MQALEGAVKKAGGTFARCKCTQHENRCYEMDHPLQAKLVRGFQDGQSACCGRRLSMPMAYLHDTIIQVVK